MDSESCKSVLCRNLTSSVENLGLFRELNEGHVFTASRSPEKWAGLGYTGLIKHRKDFFGLYPEQWEDIEGYS